MYFAGVMLSCLPVAVQVIGWCRGYMRMLLAVAVQALWDIVRCMFTIIHCNAGICMSGVVSRLCTVCGCTIASGCVSGCTVLGVCRDITGGGCAGTGDDSWWYSLLSSTPK